MILDDCWIWTDDLGDCDDYVDFWLSGYFICVITKIIRNLLYGFFITDFKDDFSD